MLLWQSNLSAKTGIRGKAGLMKRHGWTGRNNVRADPLFGDIPLLLGGRETNWALLSGRCGGASIVLNSDASAGKVGGRLKMIANLKPV